MGIGLGTAAGGSAREDHSRHDDGQGQPQPQKDHADRGSSALGHGSNQERKGRQVAVRSVGRWMDTNLDKMMRKHR